MMIILTIAAICIVPYLPKKGEHPALYKNINVKFTFNCFKGQMSQNVKFTLNC